MDILSLCTETDISKLLLGIVSHRCSDSLLYLCLSCVYRTTRSSTPQAGTHFPDFSLITYEFPNFSTFSRLTATLTTTVPFRFALEADLGMGRFLKSNPKSLDPTQPTEAFTRLNTTHHRHAGMVRSSALRTCKREII